MNTSCFQLDDIDLIIKFLIEKLTINYFVGAEEQDVIQGLHWSIAPSFFGLTAEELLCVQVEMQVAGVTHSSGCISFSLRAGTDLWPKI